MSRRVQVFVLCEDRQSSTLIRQYLKLRGFERLRFDKLPASEGCGSQWVRERYPRAVRANRTGHVKEVLLVHIDADNTSVEDRHAELARALAAAGERPRQPHEPIAFVVPRWETETWLHHFRGVPGVVESHRGYEKFRNRQNEAATSTAEALLAAVTGRLQPPVNLPSFATAVAELKRLP